MAFGRFIDFFVDDLEGRFRLRFIFGVHGGEIFLDRFL